MVSTFGLKYTALDEQRPEWGCAALLPWDEAIFGFPVGDYQLDSHFKLHDSAAVAEVLKAWARDNWIELISCGVPADHRLAIASLSRLGFVFVDYGLQMTLTRANKLPPICATLRFAQPGDQASIERIAEGAFEFGRYHADARFPVHLANLRYRRWVCNALAECNDQVRVYVLGQPGAVLGFMHVVIDGNSANLRLGAVDRSAHLGIAGFNLYAGVVAALKAENIKYITAKIPAANTQVLNLYMALGFQASKPEVVFHWHSPFATHLVDVTRGAEPLNAD